MSCPDCFKGAAYDGKPAGTEETLHGVLTYVASPPTGPTSSSTIILITDAFGFNLVNSKLLADTYASETGCKVLVPDIIPGGGVPVDSLQLMERASAPVAALDLAGQASRAYNVALMLTRFLPFAIRTRNVFPSVLAYARAIKAELPAGSKLGAAGFCWGALQTINLAKESSIEGGEEPLLAAHFAAHPSGFRTPESLVEACKGRRVPVSIAVGDRDTILSVEAAKTIKEGLEGAYEQEPEKVEFVTYGECGHGFAVRADPAKVAENEGAAKAAEQAVVWFRRYLL